MPRPCISCGVPPPLPPHHARRTPHAARSAQRAQPPSAAPLPPLPPLAPLPPSPPLPPLPRLTRPSLPSLPTRRRAAVWSSGNCCCCSPRCPGSSPTSAPPLSTRGARGRRRSSSPRQAPLAQLWHRSSGEPAGWASRGRCYSPPRHCSSPSRCSRAPRSSRRYGCRGGRRGWARYGSSSWWGRPCSTPPA